MRLQPFCESAPGGGAGDNPYAMCGVSLDNGWGLGAFVRRGRAVDPGPELGADSLEANPREESGPCR